MATTRTTRASSPDSMVIEQMRRQTISVCILGTSPLFLNRMSEKGLQQLLFPRPPKTRAEKAGSMKHDPRAEFRAAAERINKEDAPTYLALQATAFKGAMMTAALRTPGTMKTEIGQLVFINQDKVPVYGDPKLHMTVVRSADINKTPDIRSRPIIERWATELMVTYAVPLLNEKTVLTLLANAGLVAGVGDWRQEKGKGYYGQFMVVDSNNPEWVALTKEPCREAQITAMERADPYDEDTAELLAWFDDEVNRRGKFEVVA